jgi:hypothetical protein
VDNRRPRILLAEYSDGDVQSADVEPQLAGSGSFDAGMLRHGLRRDQFGSYRPVMDSISALPRLDGPIIKII